MIAAGVVLLGVLAGVGPSVEGTRAYGEFIAQAHAAYDAGDLARAEASFREAWDMEPASEEAGLGLAMVLMAGSRWAEVRDTCSAVLARSPGNRLALLRRALAGYWLRDYDQARRDYQRAHELDPEDPVAMAGLGWTELRAGNREAALRWCREAGAEDCVVAAQALGPSPGWGIEAAAYVTSMGYTDPWNRRDLTSTLLTGTVRSPDGLALSVDWSRTVTTLDYSPRDEDVTTLGFGLRGEGERWRVGAHLMGQTVDRAATYPVAAMYGSMPLGRVEPWLEAAWSSPEGHAKIQTRGGMRLGLTSRLWATTGLGWGRVWTRGRGRGQGEDLWSGHVGLRYVPVSWAALEFGGWYGRRRFSIESCGLVASTVQDLYVYGLSASLGVDLGPWAFAWLRAAADRGAEQEARGGQVRPHDFWLAGATLGAGLRW